MNTAAACWCLGLLAAPAAAGASLICHAAAGFGNSGPAGPEQYGTLSASAQASYPGATLGAASWASYGLVGARASVEADPGRYAVTRALAEAAFSDRLTVGGGAGGGAGMGFITYTLRLSGAATGDADAHIFFTHAAAPPEELAEGATSGGEYSTTHAFAFGEPFGLSVSILVLASVGPGESGVSAGDFWGGAALTGLEVFDADMRPLRGWSIRSESGASYPVPAPGAPVFAGAACCITRRRRRPTPCENTP